MIRSVLNVSLLLAVPLVGGLVACGVVDDENTVGLGSSTASATGTDDGRNPDANDGAPGAGAGSSGDPGGSGDSGPGDGGPDDGGPDDGGPDDGGPDDGGPGKNFDEGHPNIFLNQAEVDGILAKIEEGKEPWVTARDNLLLRATAALDEPLRSVTFGGPNVCGANSVYCYDEGDPYDWTEGAEPLAEAVRDLGMGYAFSGNAEYAEKAIELMNAWALDPETGMKPELSSSASQIQLYSVMGGFFYGADLVFNYPGWDTSDRAALQEWVREFGTHGMNKGVGDNNFANWKNAFVSAAGAFSEDQVLLDYAFQRYQEMIPIQIDSSGRMTWEFDRTSGAGGLHYSMYAIHAMAQCAEVARHHGVDLYSYTDDRGIGIEDALDFMAPYVEDPSSWPYYGTIHSGNGPGVFEVAYSRWQKSAYLDVIAEWDRPFTMSIGWAFGAITLTHGRTAAEAAYPM